MRITNLLGLAAILFAGFVAASPVEDATTLNRRQTKPTVRLTSSVSVTSNVAFVSKPSYLQLNVAYAPVLSVMNQLNNILPYTLKSRGEAHITILRPDEFSALTRTGRFTATSLTSFAQRVLTGGLQSGASGFSVQCLGRAQSGSDFSYFIVVNSPALLTVRRAIDAEYKRRAATTTSVFNANDFQPHITVGFTTSDLFNIVKDKTSCAWSCANISFLIGTTPAPGCL